MRGPLGSALTGGQASTHHGAMGVTEPIEPGKLVWRAFQTRAVREARAFAAAGGLAVHRNLFKLRGHETWHLLGPDEATLIAAGRLLGLDPVRLHRSRTLHFDLVGDSLARALARCDGHGEPV